MSILGDEQELLPLELALKPKIITGLDRFYPQHRWYWDELEYTFIDLSKYEFDELYITYSKIGDRVIIAPKSYLMVKKNFDNVVIVPDPGRQRYMWCSLQSMLDALEKY